MTQIYMKSIFPRLALFGCWCSYCFSRCVGLFYVYRCFCI